MVKKITKAILKKRAKRLLKRQNKELWIRLRKEVIQKQGNKCYLCDKPLQDHVDTHHIIDRRVKSLTFDILNLVALCKRCHRLDPLAVHQSSIYFAEKLRIKESERYLYLLAKVHTT